MTLLSTSLSNSLEEVSKRFRILSYVISLNMDSMEAVMMEALVLMEG